MELEDEPNRRGGANNLYARRLESEALKIYNASGGHDNPLTSEPSCRGRAKHLRPRRSENRTWKMINDPFVSLFTFNFDWFNLFLDLTDSTQVA